jgi:hypothetical protein
MVAGGSRRSFHFSAHGKSGKTIVDYCRGAGLNPQTFYQWRHEAANRRKVARTLGPPEKLTFSEVTGPLQAAAPLRSYRIRFPFGTELEIPFGSDPDDLRGVIRVLRGGARC